jgi:hypothetical protein
VTWRWRLEKADGTELSDPASPVHPNQSDAESWIGERWRELADSGVAQVTLFNDERKIYGPMPLAES